jgi:uncharacterized protein YuzE
MKISYDPEVDAMSITFRETTVTSQRVAEGVALDFDAEGHLAGIEILDAVRRFGNNDTLRQVTLENVGLGEPA